MSAKYAMRLRDIRGFTLTELVVVIIIVGILTAFAAARMNTKGFDAEGFANEVAATVRYAQRTAISQHRVVAVTIAGGSGGSVSLTYPVIGQPVRKPPGADPFTVAKAGITVSGSAGFRFNALGRPVDAAGDPIATVTLTITGSDSPPTTKTITIEAETGYVRYMP